MAEVRALQQVERGSRSGLFHDVEGVFILLLVLLYLLLLLVCVVV